MEPVAFTPLSGMTGADDAALFELFSRARAHDLGMDAWDETMRLTLLKLQFDAQRRGYAQQFPSAQTCFLSYDGRPAGWLIVERTPRSIHVVDVAVVPDARGRGLGTAALRALQDEAAGHGVPITLSVARDNAAAIRLYSRLGFDEAGGDDVYLALRWRPRVAKS
jgi:ribosomal protein S18 acetylase RimI-like enzyme